MSIINSIKNMFNKRPSLDERVETPPPGCENMARLVNLAIGTAVKQAEKNPMDEVRFRMSCMQFGAIIVGIVMSVDDAKCPLPMKESFLKYINYMSLLRKILDGKDGILLPLRASVGADNKGWVRVDRSGHVSPQFFTKKKCMEWNAPSDFSPIAIAMQGAAEEGLGINMDGVVDALRRM